MTEHDHSVQRLIRVPCFQWKMNRDRHEGGVTDGYTFVRLSEELDLHFECARTCGQAMTHWWMTADRVHCLVFNQTLSFNSICQHIDRDNSGCSVCFSVCQVKVLATSTDVCYRVPHYRLNASWLLLPLIVLAWIGAVLRVVTLLQQVTSTHNGMVLQN